jgi:hypothetical protein
MLTLGHRLLNGTLVAALVWAAAPAFVQQASAGEGIGIVTGIQGQATVSRVALPQPAALRFKDDVFFRDQIATREHSTVRLLLGGKGSLTVREQSQLTLDEAVTPDGGRRSVIGLLAGKIGAAIAHALMRPGESVEIHTPNAVAAVRGTVLIAEYIPPQGSAAASQPILLASAAPGPVLAQAAGAGGTSNFFVLSGQVTITPQGQPPLTLGPLQAVSVTATPGGVQAGAVRNITPAEAAEAAQGLETGKPHTGEVEGGKTAQAQAEVAAAIANVILQATGQPTTTTVTAPPTPTNTVTPVVPQPAPAAIIGENVLPAGPLLSLDNVTLGLATGTSLATFSAGAANAVTPLAIGGGGVAVLTAPLLEATGTPITHDGAIVTLDNAAAIVGASEDTTTPLVKIDGTALTNTGGAVFNLSGGSALTTFGPVLALQAEGSATLAGVMSIGGGSVVALGSADALVIPSGSSLTATAPLYTLAGGSTLDTYGGGALVAMDPSTLTLSAPIVSATGSTVALAGPALRAVDSTITGSQPLVLLQSGSELISSVGPVLDLTNSSLDLGSQPVVALQGGSTFTTTAGPIIRINGGSLTADSLGSTDGNGNTWNLTGTLLDLTNATVQLRKLGGGPESSTDIATFSLAAGEPTIRMSNSSLTLTGVGEELLPTVPTTTTTVGGLGLIASGSTITLAGPLLSLDGVTLTATDPYIQLSNSTVSQTGANSLIEATAGSWANVAGPLLSDSGGNFTLAGKFLGVRNGAALTATTTLPLLQFSGSTVSTNGTSFNNGASFNVGSDPGQPGSTVTLAGPLLSASNSTFDSGPGANFFSVRDGAIFTSTTTDPLLSLTGGSVTGDGHLVVVGLSNEYSGVGSAAILVPIGSQAPASMTLAGPLLQGTDTSISANNGVLDVGDRGTFKDTTTAPLIQLGGTLGSTLTLGGPDPDPLSPTYGQQVNGRVLGVMPVLATPFSASAELFGPVLSATNTTITTTDRILGVFSETGASATLTSHTTVPLVQLTGGSVTMSGTFYPPTTNSSGTTTDTSGSFLRMSSPDPEAPATITLAGPLLYANGTTFSGNNHFLRFDENSQFTDTWGGGLVHLTGVTLNANGTETFVPTSGSTTTTTFGDFARVQGPGTSVSLAGDFLDVESSSITTAGHFVRLQSDAPTMTIAGALVYASNSTLKNGDPTFNTASFLSIFDSAVLTSTTGSSAGLLSFDNSTVDTAGNIVVVRRSNSPSAPSTLTLSGEVLFYATNSSFNTTSSGYPGGSACCSGFFIGQGSKLTSSGTSMLIYMNNSTFNAGGAFFTVEDGGVYPGETNTTVAPSNVSLASQMITTANASTITALNSLLSVTRSNLSSTSSNPLLQLGTPDMPGSMVTLGGTDPFTGLTTNGRVLTLVSSPNPGTIASPAQVTLSGGGLLDTVNATLTLTSDVVGVFNGATLSSVGPLIVLNNSSLTAGTATIPAQLLNVTGTGGPSGTASAQVSLSGALLWATNSPLSLTGSLVSISGGGQLISMTTDPLITLTGGTHSIGSVTATGTGSLLNVVGVNTDETGLGTDQVLQTSGTIFQAGALDSGVTTVNLVGSGNAIVVDTATLNASAPIVNLINSTLNTASPGDPINGAMWVNQSYVNSVGPVFQLNTSTLNVVNGPLLSVTGGSQMTVTGDFASLLNGSKLTVLNGPLISVSGTSPTGGLASTLNITGALVNFGGTGGNNQVIINNGITPNKIFYNSGIPVYQCDGCSISIPGYTAIKGSPGTVTVNGTAVIPATSIYTGSVIQATGGGKVTISAP